MLHVFLDTEVFQRENLHFGSKRFQRLADQVAREKVTVYVSDVVVGEVRNAIEASVHEAVAHLKQKDTRRRLGVLAQSETANLYGVVAKLNEQAIADELNVKFATLLDRLRAAVLSSDDISVAELRERYFNASPPFASNAAKKHEFPDALSIMAAQSYAKDRNLTLHIVSADTGVAAACGTSLEHVTNLQEMISRGWDSNLARDAQEAVEVLDSSIKEEIKKKFLGSGFYVEDDIEGEVLEVRVLDLDLGEAMVAELEERTARLELLASVDFEADLQLTDPGQVAYDSETKSVFVFGFLQRTTVDQCYLEVEVEIDVDPEHLADSQVLPVSLFGGDSGGDFGLSYDWDKEWM